MSSSEFMAGIDKFLTTAPECSSTVKTVSRRRRCRCRNGKCSRQGWHSYDFPQSFSVGVKGRPRSPLNSFFSRRSLELLLRRLMPGATNWLLSRRARRPFSQSSQLIEPSIGMQGTFDFEFISNFSHKLHTLREITIFWTIRNPFDFVPIHCNFTT